MHHRVKNLFAITSSIITLSARNATSAAALAADMRNRLVSLSRAHEITLPSFTGDSAFQERRMTLFQLLSTILEPFSEDGQGRWALKGSDFEIAAKDVTNFALLFHELASNAAKYGALSVPDGRLQIEVEITGETSKLRWLENNGPGQSPASTHVGFGTRLAQTVARSLAGEIEREWRPEGLCVTLTLTLAQQS